MSIGVIATLPVKEDKAEEFRTAFLDLAEKVNANEDGCLHYELFQKQSDANVFVVMEIYKDQDALATHGGTDYFKAVQPLFGECLAGAPTIELMNKA